jgi:hypothetical protein
MDKTKKISLGLIASIIAVIFVGSAIADPSLYNFTNVNANIDNSAVIINNSNVTLGDGNTYINQIPDSRIQTQISQNQQELTQPTDNLPTPMPSQKNMHYQINQTVWLVTVGNTTNNQIETIVTVTYQIEPKIMPYEGQGLTLVSTTTQPLTILATQNAWSTSYIQFFLQGNLTSIDYQFIYNGTDNIALSQSP